MTAVMNESGGSVAVAVDDLVARRDQLRQENEVLRAQNERLTSEITEIKELWGRLIQQIDDRDQDILELKAANKTLIQAAENSDTVRQQLIERLRQVSQEKERAKIEVVAVAALAGGVFLVSGAPIAATVFGGIAIVKVVM